VGASDIREFAEALERRRGGPAPASSPPLDKVAVLGGGAHGRAIAACCLAAGAEVTLFSAYRQEMGPLREAGSITIRGEGPIGTYRVGGEGRSLIRLTGELDEAVAGADVVVVTGPVLKQRTYSMVLAGHLRDGQVVVLAPGRTFGAIEAAWYLRAGGNASALGIVELGALPHWVAAEGKALRLSAAEPAPAGVLPAGQGPAPDALRRYFPNAEPSPSLLQATFGDAGGIVEATALALGGPCFPGALGRLMTGAVPLPENDHFRGLLGESHLNVIARLLEERQAVASCFGVRELPGAEAAVRLHAGATEGSGVRPVPADPHAVLRCAVMGSLVPLLSAAKVAGKDAPLTAALVALAEAAVGSDLTNAGRHLDRLGIPVGDPDAAARRLAAAAEGGF